MEKEITFEDVKKMEYGYTHAGVFHADDVFSAALLKIINPEIRIIRTFDPPKDRNAIIFDVGGGKYDHHGVQEYRLDNIGNPKTPYAAFGKLWRDLGLEVCEGYEEAFRAVDRDLVSEIDWTDCLGCSVHYNTLSISIAAMNPTYEEISKEGNLCRNRKFDEAVIIAEKILRRIIYSDVSKSKCREVVESIIPNYHILCLEEYMPWKDFIVKKNIENGINSENAVYFAIYPSLRGGYNVETVPSGAGDNSVLVSFPKEWWGASKDKLPKGINFCHASGFLLATDSKANAYKVAKNLIYNHIKTYQ